MNITKQTWMETVVPAGEPESIVDKLEFEIFHYRKCLRESNDAELLEHYARELGQARIALAALYQFNEKG